MKMGAKQKPHERALKLVESRYGLMLATASKGGYPHASFTYFVKYGDSFYVYTSDLSAHTQNMQSTKRASALFIEDEKDAKNQLARKRFSCACTVEQKVRDSEDWANVLHGFEKKYGEEFKVIRSLADFRLFELKPVFAGTYVEGFGQAYVIGHSFSSSEHIKR